MTAAYLKCAINQLRAATQIFSGCTIKLLTLGRVFLSAAPSNYFTASIYSLSAAPSSRLMAVVSPGRGIGGAAISKAPKPHTPRTPLKGMRKLDVFSFLFGLRSGGECPHSGPGVFGADAPRNFADSYTVPWETKRPYPAALSALDPETANHFFM